MEYIIFTCTGVRVRFSNKNSNQPRRFRISNSNLLFFFAPVCTNISPPCLDSAYACLFSNENALSRKNKIRLTLKIQLACRWSKCTCILPTECSIEPMELQMTRKGKLKGKELLITLDLLGRRHRSVRMQLQVPWNLSILPNKRIDTKKENKNNLSIWILILECAADHIEIEFPVGSLSSRKDQSPRNTIVYYTRRCIGREVT